jgi:dienelactone hydrolase
VSYLWYWPSAGWDFDRWKRRQGWRAILSSQSRRPEPLRLLRKGSTLHEWEEKAPMWRAISSELLGTLHDKPPRRQRWQWLGDEFRGGEDRGYRLRRLRYQLTDDGEWGYAWLLQPLAGRPRARPALIALHETHPLGKHHPVGLAGTPGEFGTGWAIELVQRGYVVLAPDAVGFGERQAGLPSARYDSADAFFRVHPNGSVAAKMAFDTSRAVDLLETLEGVDPSRIGCVGHSHGGYGTLFAMLADRRIRCGVISCGLNLLRSDPTPQRWWRSTALIPRLGLYEQDISETPLDFHHWLALLAPRPVTVIAASHDAIFPRTAHLGRSLATVRDVYALYGARGQIRVKISPGPHEFPIGARRRAWRALDGAVGVDRP